MNWTCTSPLRVGQVIEISFATFTPRISIGSERELTVDVVAGAYLGFSDTVEYEAIAVRDDVVILSWQEHNGSTIMHALDFSSCITSFPANGGTPPEMLRAYWRMV
jgi:hypothetical protein